MRRPRSSVWRLWLVAAGVLGVVLIAVASDERATADDDYLRNFQVVPTAEEVVVEARAAGETGPIHVPQRELPQPDAVPTRFGPYLLVPEGWIGPREETSVLDVPMPEGTPTTDLAVLQSSALWRAPEGLPGELELIEGRSDALDFNVILTFGERAQSGAGYANMLDFAVMRILTDPIDVPTWGSQDSWMTTEIDGHPAVLWYGPELDGGLRHFAIRIVDEESGLEYSASTLSRYTPDQITALVRSMLP